MILQKKANSLSISMKTIYMPGEESISYCKFKWLKNVDTFDVNSISENSSIGYILEVDLEYPDKLHYLHNDCPLASEKLATSYDVLLNYCTKITDEYEIKLGDVKKLVQNFGNKLCSLLQKSSVVFVTCNETD